MNLYIRYFDFETLVYSVDECIECLASIPEIGMDKDLESDIRDYVASDMRYPKRYKLRPRVYFIIIKTTAETMEDFKAKKALAKPAETAEKKEEKAKKNALPTPRLVEKCEGWYEATMNFKRVIMIPGTGKFEYKDCSVVYQCKAVTPFDCYNRVVDYLRSRVDRRSQFPSAKGRNFKYKYLGRWK